MAVDQLTCAFASCYRTHSEEREVEEQTLADSLVVRGPGEYRRAAMGTSHIAGIFRRADVGLSCGYHPQREPTQLDDS